MITALWEGIGGWHWSLDTDDAVYSGLRATEAEARAEMDDVMRDLRAQDAAQVDALRARAEAAEAEVERLRVVIKKAVDDLPEWSDGALKHLSPAEAMADEVRMALRAAVTR